MLIVMVTVVKHDVLNMCVSNLYIIICLCDCLCEIVLYTVMCVHVFIYCNLCEWFWFFVL